MADEITISVSISCAKSNLIIPQHGGSVRTWTLTGDQYASGFQSIGTTLEALTIQDVSTTGCGWGYFRNCDATNYVEIGQSIVGTFRAGFRLNAGEETVVRLTKDSAPYGKANTAAVILQFLVLED